MVETVSFNKRIPPGRASRGTLAELMAKQKLLSERRTNFSEVQPIQSWTQGLAQMSGALTTGLQERAAANEEQAGRARLAELQAGAGPEGYNPAQLAEIHQLDPDLAESYRKEALELRLRKEDRQLKLADEQSRRTYEDEREGRIDTRELAQDTAAEKARRDEAERVRLAGIEGETVINEREKLEQEARDKASRDEAERVRLASIEGGKETIISDPAQVAAMGGTAGQTIIKTADGTLEIKDAPKPGKMSRPATAEERVQYNIPAGQGLKMTSEDGVNWEPTGVGSGITVSGSDAAKIALGEAFSAQVPGILREIDAGVLTGPVDYVRSTFGSGRPGEIRNKLATAADVVILHLTGQGRGQREAEDYAQRFLPSVYNTKADIRAKVLELNRALKAMAEGVLTHDFDTYTEAKKKAGPGEPAGTPLPEEPAAAGGGGGAPAAPAAPPAAPGVSPGATYTPEQEQLLKKYLTPRS